ncbi:DUF2306 domain-containing protein [Candidatus Leptofilum sp.]|uniref:DUF2306 domain-containing protein n=1 Tax=Candidatus Leptofilum sp. TaxID=3241576 RepID=UPI003B5C8D84
MNNLQKVGGTAVPQINPANQKNNLKKGWLAPALLLALGSLNVLSGAMQLNNIQQGPPPVPDEFTAMQYFLMPIPIVLHIVGGILFNLLGPLQFAPAIWQRWPQWHRWSGRLLIVAGFMVAFSGLWMNHFYPAYGGVLKYSGIMVNSLGLAVSLLIAVRAILVRDIPHHRVWMMRAIAFGLGPATQRLFVLPIFFITGSISNLMIGFVIWLGFSLNLLVVEWILWRERTGKSNGEVQHDGRILGQKSVRI